SRNQQRQRGTQALGVRGTRTQLFEHLRSHENPIDPVAVADRHDPRDVNLAEHAPLLVFEGAVCDLGCWVRIQKVHWGPPHVATCVATWYQQIRRRWPPGWPPPARVYLGRIGRDGDGFAIS